MSNNTRRTPGQTSSPTPRQRLFTDERDLGEEVAIIRDRHGWYDAEVVGRIVVMEPYRCVVEDDDGRRYEIPHPRDIL